MPRICIFLIVLLGASAALAAAQAPEYVPGRLIVKFKTDITIVGAKTGIASVDALNEKYGVTSIVPLKKDPRSPQDIQRKYPQRAKRAPMDSQPKERFSGGIYVLTMPAHTPILKAVKEYSKDTAVEYAQPDYLAQILDMH